MKKILSPSELATLQRKAKYSMSLTKTNMDKIKAQADKENIPFSQLVDYAIAQYLKSQKLIP